MARVILRSRHVTRDGERETNGGKRKGERKEDTEAGTEREALARSGTDTAVYQKTRPRNCCKSRTARDRRAESVRGAEKGTKRAQREEEERLPSADRQVAETMTTMRDKERERKREMNGDKEREAARRVSTLAWKNLGPR